MEAPRPLKRRRSREEPAERRRKDRQRKRIKRGRKAAVAPVVEGSSTESEDGGNAAETARNQHPEAYLFAEAPREAGGWGQGGPARKNDGREAQGFPEETTCNSSSMLLSEEEQVPTQNLIAETERVEEGNREELDGIHAQYSGISSDDGGATHDREGRSEGQEEHGQEGEQQGTAGDSARDPAEGTGAPAGHPRNNEEEGEGGQGGGIQGIPQDFREPSFNPTERLAMALAGVRGSSEVSDSAINKLLKVALEHGEALEAVVRGKSKKDIYTKKLRPRALRHIPRVFTAILLEEKVQGGLEYRRLEDLAAIPKEYVNLPNKGNLRIIREESYVKLKDIKEHHKKIHEARGITQEELRNHYENAAISVDGVEEGNKCKKTFHVVTLRLGSCIYLYKIFNPLVGHRVANPSVQEVLG